MARRSRIEIVIDILDNIARNPGLSPTRLATYANLSYDRLTGILELLEAKDLIVKEDDSRNSYTLTGKGRTLLKEMKRMKRILVDFGLDIL